MPRKTKKQILEEKRNTKRNEIAGVIFIALAVLCALGLYFNVQSAFGDGVKYVLSGLFGVASYVFPVACGVIGVLFIAARKSRPDAGRVFLIVLLVIVIISLLHISVAPSLNRDDFVQFVSESFTVGSADCMGGGFAGSLLCYPCFIALGELGSYIVFIAAIAVLVIAFTNISIKKMGADIGHAVKTGYDNYVEYIDLWRDERAKKREQQPLFIEDLNKTQQQDTEEYEKNPYDIKIEAGRNTISVGKIYKETKKEQPAEVPEEPKEEVSELKYDSKFSEINESFVEETVKLTMEGRKATNEVKLIKQRGILEQRMEEMPVSPEPSEQYTEEEEIPFVPEKPAPTKRKLSSGSTTAKKQSEETFDVPEEKTKKTKKFTLPPVSILREGDGPMSVNAKDKRENAVLLENTLANFGIDATVESICVGPVVTRYEVKPAAGIKVSRIVNLSDDIALAFAVAGVRIEAPIPGKAAVGIEVPNSDRSGVCLRDLLSSQEYRKIKTPTMFALGKDIAGKNIYADMCKMPHLLIAGETNSGKSVCENTIICSILFNATPDEVRLILIDPKMVELTEYNNIPHLLVPVVTDIKKAPAALQWAVNEMTMRYRKLSNNGSKDIYSFNNNLPEGMDPLPQLIIVIDELAELMMASPKEVEDSICRIAQLGRAAGIHLVVATQRPSVNVITGVIKANIPSRIAFSVASQIDSRTILDQNGAEKLLGRGDMLFLPTGTPKPLRVQGCFVSEAEIRDLCEFLRNNSNPNYDERIEEEIAKTQTKNSKECIPSEDEEDDTDRLFEDAVRLVVDSESASISMLQRRFRIGYARAARLIDEMEVRGYVSGFEGSKPRQVLISKDQVDQIFDYEMPEDEG